MQVIGRIMASRYIHVLNPVKSEYVAFHSRGYVADVTKLKMVRCGDYPG